MNQKQDARLTTGSNRAARAWPENPIYLLAQQIGALATTTVELDGRAVKALTRTWNELQSNPSIDQTLRGHIERINKIVTDRTQAQREQRKRHRVEIEEMLGNLESALEQGQLQQSLSLHQRLEQRLHEFRNLNQKQQLAISSRINTAGARLRELKDWRRWGTDQARLELIEYVQPLLESNVSPPEIARQIRKAREAWKKLDRSAGPARKSLWSRFDKACTAAYQPCTEYFAELAATRRLNFEKRAALCERLENYFGSTDWTQPDWRAADKLVRQSIQHWRRRDPIDRNHKKNLDRRFNEIIEQFSFHLDRERERNLKKRKKLIANAQTLAAGGNLDTAIQNIKALQDQWQPTVLCPAKTEEQLWLQFRTACDAVYDQRRKQRAAENQEYEANLKNKLSLCEELEKLVTSNHPLLASKAHLSQIKVDWGAIGNVPRKSAAMIERRFKKACDKFEKAYDALAIKRYQDQLDILRMKSDLCLAVENIIAVKDRSIADKTIIDCQQRWAQLSQCAPSTEDQIRKRFDMAQCAATEKPEIISMEQRLRNRSMLEELCLRMEILAEIDSPPDAAQTRLQLQVQRLSEAMKGHKHKQETSAANNCNEIEREFYLCGPATIEHTEKIVTRFRRARDAFYAKEQT
ncbi:MAG: DUF349 domain-containing protein [Gammaproteobacteria bacterium]|nr:DUF349 domain-containing protein [Gammaproteobacteria bacterium]